MKKKNVYFVQVDVSASANSQNAYLPYTAGILTASAFSSDTVKKNCEFKEFIFLREDTDTVVSRLEEPAFVGFSCYCWSTEYNKLLAKKIKEKYPSCLIVFGGHDVPDDFGFMEKNTFIDVLCHGEGEETVKDLLEAFVQKKSFDTVNNISFRNADGKYIRTDTRLQTTLDYPSPYLEGWFDNIIANHPEINFNAILETSRGCPNQCAYCDWGPLKTKTRLFPMDRIKAEIRWMCDHKIAFVWGADANFGMYDRDLEIADELVKAKKETGYPERMRMNYAKNRADNVFAIVKKFKECEFDRIGATLSFQSMSPEVQKNIGRSNSSLDFYKELLLKYNKEKMRTYSELILGLPGETYESFIKGIGMLFETGQHFVFEIYNCILLPNSLMGQKEYIEKYGIKTVNVEIVRSHVSNTSFSVPEYNNIIVETNSMSREDWIKASVFGHLTKALHGNGLIRIFALYLRYEMNIPFEKFYDSVLTYFEENPELFISKLYADIKEKTRKLSLGISNERLLFEPTREMVWEEHEYFVLNSLLQLDLFYDEIIPFLKSFGIPEAIFSDILTYQKAVLRKPAEKENKITLKYDLHRFATDIYLNNIHPLKKQSNILILKDSKTYNTWQDFAKYVIWFEKIGWASYKDDITEI